MSEPHRGYAQECPLRIWIIILLSRSKPLLSSDHDPGNAHRSNNATPAKGPSGVTDGNGNGYGGALPEANKVKSWDKASAMLGCRKGEQKIGKVVG